MRQFIKTSVFISACLLVFAGIYIFCISPILLASYTGNDYWLWMLVPLILLAQSLPGEKHGY